MLRRSGDPRGAKVLVDDALELLKGGEDAPAHFDALTVRATIGAWLGEVDDAVRYLERAYAIAIDSRRKDLQTIAAQALVQLHIGRLELDEAELLITRALELAGESGSVRARVSTTLSYGKFLLAKDEIDAAETIFEEVRTTAVELGLEHLVAHAHAYLAWTALRRGDVKRAEKHAREAVRITTSRGDRGMLPEIEALLACTLADAGKLDEAERYALAAQESVSREDPSAVVSVTTALAVVRAGQGTDREAEELFERAITLARKTQFKTLELDPLRRVVPFLQALGRDEDAAVYEERLAELAPSPSAHRIPSPEPSAGD
jgi:tetratricopeptide (TPR) repeat protein